MKENPFIDPRFLDEKEDQFLYIDVTVEGNKNALEVGANKYTVPKSLWIDLKNDFSDQNAEFPMTMLDVKAFVQVCNSLGISPDTKIVFFDRVGTYYSPRAWWMFRAMGFDNIRVLDGGLPAWIDCGLPLALQSLRNLQCKESFSEEDLIIDNSTFVNLNFILDAINDSKICIVDARSNDRFKGLVAEPRQGVRSGNIPGSINLPFGQFIENGHYKSDDQIAEIFDHIPADVERIVFSCGSGVTACIPAIKAAVLTDKEVSIYDGSWTEFATITTL